MHRRDFIRVGVASGLPLALGCRGDNLSAPLQANQPLAVQLGFRPTDRLLIVHADDAGYCGQSTAAVIEAFERRAIDAASVMVPCPGFEELAFWARQNPTADIGIHLTFVGERPGLRIRPILPSSQIPTLVDQSGNFPLGWPGGRIVDLVELEAEARAQIETAIAAGIRPTHLDSHQHVLQRRGPEAFEVLVRIAHDYRLPFRRSREWFAKLSYLRHPPGVIVAPLDSLLSIGKLRLNLTEWTRWYVDRIYGLGPGVAELIIHPSRLDPALEELMADSPNWGAQWRGLDLAVATGQELKIAIRESRVRRIGWRPIMNAVRQGGS